MVASFLVCALVPAGGPPECPPPRPEGAAGSRSFAGGALLRNRTRYADYDSKTDKVAAYGIAALIGGGLAAKAGLFAKLGVLLLGLKKLLIPLALVALAFGRKIFGLFKRDRTATVG